MTSKKQSKAYEQKRNAEFQRKIAAAKVEQQRKRKMAAYAAGALVAVVIVVLVAVMLTSNDDSPAVVPSSSAEPTATASASDIDVDTEGWANSLTPPGPELAEAREWTVDIDTNQGPITVQLDGVNAPQAVASFVSLGQDGFFNNTDCHRLTTEGIYVLQCGDPTGTGTGGPAYRFGPLENTPQDDLYPAGTLAMARVGNDPASMGSQFFIVYDDSVIPSDAAGGYTVFGEVTQGLAIVEDVAQAGTITGDPDGRPAQSVIINEVSVS
ncbi:peptidylprolyl isomerase [Demequina aurantiaca]|uniref:peptidylprolyl isomerase n=1 Tax=Demequina aurantiaca TaxID=676200 RepID=UPI0007822AD6|nr:peptidylprolyl isomerase [Demequina aurantiaca]